MLNWSINTRLVYRQTVFLHAAILLVIKLGYLMNHYFASYGIGFDSRVWSVGFPSNAPLFIESCGKAMRLLADDRLMVCVCVTGRDLSFILKVNGMWILRVKISCETSLTCIYIVYSILASKSHSDWYLYFCNPINFPFYIVKTMGFGILASQNIRTAPSAILS